ncbi:hypothetical protein ACFQ8E_14050 [Isoptericola sp. NPDC056573]|uniref:hypothetical protein n=1 Tax=Isoptericola sp. NPDC056573 TaxID=3345868 RepID=UPI0036CA4073
MTATRAGRRMRGRGVSSVALLTVGVAVLAGCQTAPGPSVDPDVVVARYEPTGAGGDQALLRGRVAAVHGCIVVDDESSDTVYTVIFPAEAPIPPLGEDVELVGGAHDRLPDGVTTNGCETAPFWLVSADE